MVSSVIEYDPVVMVSSPRPLPPIHDLKQLGLPSSLTQASVHTHAPVCAYMHASMRSCVRECVGACVHTYIIGTVCGIHAS